ncbi:hypothetical protein GGI15_004035 [Coemansia interrupta]|uniref:Pentatricopeptide repeat-containing protein n=1 Tax=Coemansia interrupta TaxID=1126814 RepID=A0A9W8HC14_9FUNG|nr:hypothetical protein GGI15_004035 [Coemansia interrupta]
MISRPNELTSERGVPRSVRNRSWAGKKHSGRTNNAAGMQVELLSTKIQMLSLATQCRQYTTLRLPRSQGSLPVASLTTFTLWARTIHTLLTFSPQDRVTSAAPLLRMKHMGYRGYVAGSQGRRAALVQGKEREIEQLASSAQTVGRAVAMYRVMMGRLPQHSLTPWMLLSQCYDKRASLPGELRWLADSLGVVHGGVGRRGVEELLALAYLKLGQGRRLREWLVGLSVRPVRLSSSTMVLLLGELQGTPGDRQLACRLWETHVEVAGFAPSQTCVLMAMRIAMHAQKVDLAVDTYKMVLARRWGGVRAGFWAEKVIVYGLAINKRAREAFEVALATTDVHRVASNETVALQTLHKYELLLSGLSRVRCAEDSEAVFAYVRDDLGLRPSAAMYTSLLGVLAMANVEWEAMEHYLGLMEEDQVEPSEALWRRVLLGYARQGNVELCDHVLGEMAAAGVRPTYVVVAAALEVYGRQGNLEMAARWMRLVFNAMRRQAELESAGPPVVNIGETLRGIDSRPPPPATAWSLEQPEALEGYFSEHSELVWHRSVLALMVDVLGELSDGRQVVQAWEEIELLSGRIRSLRLSPHIYMALARALARQGVLGMYELRVCAEIEGPRNGFTYAQREEALEYIQRCRNGRVPGRRVVASRQGVRAEEADAQPDSSV